MRSLRLNNSWPKSGIPFKYWDVRKGLPLPKGDFLMVQVGGRCYDWEDLDKGCRYVFSNKYRTAMETFDWNRLMFLGPRQDNGIIFEWIQFAYEKYKTLL